MPNEVKLLPCAWCNGPAVEVGGDYITCGAAWNPYCPGHMIRTDVECWNTRPTTVVTDEVVERVVSALKQVNNAKNGWGETLENYPALARAALASVEGDGNARSE